MREFRARAQIGPVKWLDDRPIDSFEIAYAISHSDHELAGIKHTYHSLTVSDGEKHALPESNLPLVPNSESLTELSLSFCI